MAITATERTEIEKLLVLMFNAAPGATYLSQVVSMYESMGHSLDALANTLANIPAFNTLHPNFQTSAEFAADFLTPLGLQSDSFAVNFVVSKFAAGVPKGEIMFEALAALNSVNSGYPSQYVAAKAILVNKTAVSDYYSVTKGIVQTDLNVLQLVLNGVTADPATVTTADSQIDNGTRGTSGITVSLTPSQDTVVGTASSDTINGLFGDATVSNNTFTAGDSIDGGAGIDRLNLVALGTTPSPAIIVKNVEAINIQDTTPTGATFNELLVQNSPGINFTSTLAGATATVTNADLASVMGLSGAGNLTVSYANTSGSADTANVSLSGVGTSAANSVVNVSNGNTVEKVVVATSGTNLVTLTGGTVAASLVITGAGTNSFSLSAPDSLAAVATIDASASTGTNTFALGTNLNTGTTVKGGTGADTVKATLATPTLVAPTMTGVETLATTWTAAAVVDLGTAAGLATVTASDKGAAPTAMTFQNAASSVSTLTVSNVNVAAAESTLNFGYSPTDKGALALNIGSTSTTAAPVTLGLVTLANTTGVAITTLGALAHDIAGIKVSGAQTALSVNVAAHGSLTAEHITASSTIGAETFTLGVGSYYSGGVYAAKTVGPVTATLAAGSDLDSRIEVTKGNIGADTLTATGNGIIANQTLDARNGNVGNVTINATGNNFSGSLHAQASGGTVGDINVTLTGDHSSEHFRVSGGAHYVAATATPLGGIGNITLATNGASDHLGGSFYASGGNIGNISVSMVGGTASGNLFFGTGAEIRTDAASHKQYIGGGNVGNISVNIDGSSSFHGAVHSSGGSIGNVSVNADHGARVRLGVTANASGGYSGAPSTQGNIGNVTVSVGAGSRVSGYVNASGGNVGNVGIAANGAGASGHFAVHAHDTWAVGTNNYAGGGNIGHVSVNINGDHAFFEAGAYASGGSIAGVDFSLAGTGASGGLNISAQRTTSGSTGGNVGAINITLGASTGGFTLESNFDGTAALNVVGGNGMGYDNFYISGGNTKDGSTVATLSSVSMSFGNSAHTHMRVSGFVGSVGNVSLTYGNSASAGYAFDKVTKGVGNITGTFGTGTSLHLHAENDLSLGTTSLTFGTGSHFTVGYSGGIANVGKITIAGGDASSTGNVTMADTTDQIAVFGGVDASTWAGAINIDLSGVTLGTTIRVGAAGSNVTGTEGADNIFLGAGTDTVHFDTTPTNTDVIFNFKAGTGGDVMDLIATAGTLQAVLTANPGSSVVEPANAIVRLVDIPAGDDITTAAGLKTALNTGEYANIDATPNSSFTFVTSASPTASQLFVFHVVENTADNQFDTVTLVGVVNATAAGAIGGLVAGNFM